MYDVDHDDHTEVTRFIHTLLGLPFVLPAAEITVGSLCSTISKTKYSYEYSFGEEADDLPPESHYLPRFFLLFHGDRFLGGGRFGGNHCSRALTRRARWWWRGHDRWRCPAPNDVRAECFVCSVAEHNACPCDCTKQPETGEVAFTDSPAEKTHCATRRVAFRRSRLCFSP